MIIATLKNVAYSPVSDTVSFTVGLALDNGTPLTDLTVSSSQSELVALSGGKTEWGDADCKAYCSMVLAPLIVT